MGLPVTDWTILLICAYVKKKKKNQNFVYVEIYNLSFKFNMFLIMFYTLTPL